MSDRVTILRTEGLKKSFGGLDAVDNVSIDVYRGEILSIIGPNGAGKTTLFNLLTGFHSPTEGTASIRASAESEEDQPTWIQISSRRTSGIVDLGIGRTFQNVRPFGDLTVRQNVISGLGKDWYGSLNLFRRYTTNNTQKKADNLLERVGLSDQAEAQGDELPIALQRRLEIARALALDPKLLLLDEPAGGLNEDESQDLMTLLRSLVSEELTIVLIEHSMDVVMNVSDRIYVIDQGEVIAEGVPEEIQQDERVKQAYLGEGIDA